MKMRNILIYILIAASLGLSACASRQAMSLGDAQAPQAGAAAAQVLNVPDESRAPDRPADQAGQETVAQAAPLTLAEEQALETEPEIQFDLDAYDSKEIRQHFEFFVHNANGRATFQRWLDRSALYLPYVRRAMRERGLPGDLAYLPFVESGYNPKARSRAGAAGMWQFMRYTGAKYGLEVGWWLDERLDPFQSTQAALDYLTALNEEFGDWYLALAAYNAGEGRVARALQSTGCEDFFDLSTKKRFVQRRGRRVHYLPRETRNYVPKFLAVLKIVRNLESLGFTAPDWDTELDLQELAVPPKTNLKTLAAAAGMDWEDFRNLNPGFLEAGSHPDKECTVYLPAEAHALAAAHLASGKAKPFADYYAIYKVRPGDSWHLIARRSGVPVAVLKSYNNQISNIIHPGQAIKVPGRGEAGKTLAALGNTKDSAPDAPQMEKARSLASKRGNYIARSGDSLWSVAKRYDMSLTTLALANGLGPRAGLRIGQKLYIPDQSPVEAMRSQKAADETRKIITYNVRSGDTLYSIAQRFGVTTQALQDWNQMDSARIFPGDQLKVYR